MKATTLLQSALVGCVLASGAMAHDVIPPVMEPQEIVMSTQSADSNMMIGIISVLFLLAALSATTPIPDLD